MQLHKLEGLQVGAGPNQSETSQAKTKLVIQQSKMLLRPVYLGTLDWYIYFCVK